MRSHMQPYGDYDSCTYMPTDHFPAVQDEFEQANNMTESDDDDDDINMFCEQGIEGILDQKYCSNKSGIYTFRAQGQIYHRIDQLVPSEDGPKHLQLYFYDTDVNLQHRFHYSLNLDICWLVRIFITN